MTKERLFELAVSLVAANITAGQHFSGMNFGAEIHDNVETAYFKLEELWEEVSVELDDEDKIDPNDPGPEKAH